MAKKNKWYKSKGGWIGLAIFISLFFIPYYTICPSNHTYYESDSSCLAQHPAEYCKYNNFCANTLPSIVSFPFGNLLSNPSEMGAGLPFTIDLAGAFGTFILNPILYFIVGYFIEKKYFKKRSSRRSFGMKRGRK